MLGDRRLDQVEPGCGTTDAKIGFHQHDQGSELAQFHGSVCDVVGAVIILDDAEKKCITLPD
jgi:hypothetical protein